MARVRSPALWLHNGIAEGGSAAYDMAATKAVDRTTTTTTRNGSPWVAF
ncbi:hypothetical protein ACFV8Z_31755 [Streptomyces sp. NPDC059837]